MQHLELYSNKLQIILQYQLNSCHIHLNISKPQCKLSNLVTSAFIYTIFTVQALFLLVMGKYNSTEAQVHASTQTDRTSSTNLQRLNKHLSAKEKEKKLIENSTLL